MKKLLLIFSVLMSGIGMSAQPRSEEQAKQIAQEFLDKKPQRKAPKLSVVPQQKITQQIRKKVPSAKKAPIQHSCCYIINDEANNRFVIVSADERLYEILGYSDNSCFEAEKAPEALLELMNDFSNQFSFLLQNGNQVLNKVGPAKVEPIEPMIKTKWNQLRPYFNDCPIDSRYEDYAAYEESLEKRDINIRSVTGCAATAMAQIMNYHKYPQSGIGHSDYTTTLGSHQVMDFSTITFDWENMLDEYDSDFGTDIHKEAVAELMHTCGVALRMDYTADNSGAFSVDVAYALSHYFRYNPNIKYYLRDYFSQEEWNTLILNNLRHGLPVFYGGQTKTYDEEGNIQKDNDGEYVTEGHGFVIDGCDEDLLYHINFGYSGEYDGYYPLSALTLKDNVNFELKQEMICNISPNEFGIKEDLFYTLNFSMFDVSGDNPIMKTNLKVKKGEQVGLGLSSSVNACNSSNSYNQSFKGEIGFGLFDLNCNFIKSLKKENIYSFEGLYAGYEYENQAAIVNLWSWDFETGKQYIIAPYAKSSDSERATFMRAMLFDSYLATAGNDSITISLYSTEPASIMTNDVEVPVGENVKMQIELDNKNTCYKGFQFEMSLPEGISIAKDADGLYVAELSNRCTGENLEFYITNPKENIYKFYVINTEISASQGSLIDVTIATSTNVKEGTYSSSINNVYFIKPNGKMMSLVNSKFNIKVVQLDETGIKGDANGDDVVDVADIVYIVNYIMEKPAADFNFKNADMDEDGVIDVADITLVVKKIMSAEIKSNTVQGLITSNELGIYECSKGSFCVNLPNVAQYVSSQFDVVVPAGISVKEVSLKTGLSSDHLLAYNKIGDNRYRVIIYSSKNKPFTDGTDGLLTIKTIGDANSLGIENAVFTTNLGEKHIFDTAWSQVTGINNISNDKPGHSIFALDGRNISSDILPKGIYIINGKKQVVK